MNTSDYKRIRVSSVFGLFLAAAIVSTCGCGGSDSEAVVDAAALLERYEKDQRRHDPLHFSEVDLGEFTVTQRRHPSIYFVRFHLYGVVPDEALDRFNGLLQRHQERVRSQVREATQKCVAEQFNDASLGGLRSELITSINHTIQAAILRDVVFSEFSFERG